MFKNFTPHTFLTVEPPFSTPEDVDYESDKPPVEPNVSTPPGLNENESLKEEIIQLKKEIQLKNEIIQLKNEIQSSMVTVKKKEAAVLLEAAAKRELEEDEEEEEEEEEEEQELPDSNSDSDCGDAYGSDY